MGRYLSKRISPKEKKDKGKKTAREGAIAKEPLHPSWLDAVRITINIIHFIANRFFFLFVFILSPFSLHSFPLPTFKTIFRGQKSEKEGGGTAKKKGQYNVF